MVLPLLPLLTAGRCRCWPRAAVAVSVAMVVGREETQQKPDAIKKTVMTQCAHTKNTDHNNKRTAFRIYALLGASCIRDRRTKEPQKGSPSGMNIRDSAGYCKRSRTHNPELNRKMAFRDSGVIRGPLHHQSMKRSAPSLAEGPSAWTLSSGASTMRESTPAGSCLVFLSEKCAYRK